MGLTAVWYYQTWFLKILEKEKFIQEDVDYNMLASMKYSSPPDLTYGQKPEPVNDYVPRIPPAWLKYDRKVNKHLNSM